jgi:inner membrane protein
MTEPFLPFLQSATLKAVAVGLLGLLLFAPLGMVMGLIEERAGRRDEVRQEVSAVWGGRQVVGGVALVVPFDVVQGTAPNQRVVTKRLITLPETLSIDAELVPEVRRRSIFTVVVYRTTVAVKGTIRRPDVTRLSASAVHWNQASVIARVGDLRGVVSVEPLRLGTQAVAMEPGDAQVFDGLAAAVTWDPAAESQPFQLDLVLAGSSALAFLPAGGTTEVTMHSSWADPGFTGAYLPTSSDIGSEGFRAIWRVNRLSRAYPSTWIDGEIEPNDLQRRIATSEFGANLVQTVDHYRQTDRAVKYGFLFILLTLGVFFAIEVVVGPRLHPIQYLLVGAALVVFFLLLLSLTEHIRFAAAYATAALATIGIIVGYSATILANRRSAAAIAAWLSAVYGMLYVLLQLEDLALLVGSIAVFTALAIAMYLTRKVNWYELR